MTSDKYWIALSSIEEIDSRFIQRLYNYFGDIEKAFNANDLSSIDGLSVKKAEKFLRLRDKVNPDKAEKYYNYAYETACRLNEVFYKVSSTLAFGDFYLFSKQPEKALSKYLKAKSLAEGNLSENNLKKIEKRITDLSIQLGEEKFNQIKNGIKTENE